MRALVTRPVDDAQSTALALSQRGFDVVIEPMMRILPVPGVSLDLDGVQGCLVTSANGVRALALATPRRDLPLWAVGDATAREGRALGFRQIQSANGDVESLAQLVIASTSPQVGRLIHGAGSDVAGDLSGRLSQAGFQIERVVLYCAQPVESLSVDLKTHIQHGNIDVGLFYSPRTAKIFTGLIAQAGLSSAVRSMVGLALSPAVADALAPLNLSRVAIADSPRQDALFATLDRTPFPAD